MNIYKSLKNAEYFITKMKEDLVNIKSKKQKDFTIDMLNAFIMLINNVDQINKKEPLLKVIDSLIVRRLYDGIKRSVALNDGSVDIKNVFREIDQDIKNPLKIQIEDLSGLMVHLELTKLIETNSLDSKSVKKVSRSDWSNLIKLNLKEFKTVAPWN
jgi:hypothetical protein|tara:strand:- start:1406 stop:1876 length:471 start_codon:yes stop_codon:yes gene_type:complete